MTSTFSVLIGSIGRPVLRRALDSIAGQQRFPGDQVIVSFDAFEQTPRDLEERVAIVRSYGEGFLACAYDSGYHWLGVEQINHALRTIPLTGSHVFTVGDDDIFVDDAYEVLRTYCDTNPKRPVIYKFVANHLGPTVLWDKPRMRSCRISGCCIAAPSEFVDVMHTRHETTHDFDWMVEILKKSPPPLWLDYIGVIARPDMVGDRIVIRPEWRYTPRVVDEYVGND